MWELIHKVTRHFVGSSTLETDMVALGLARMSYYQERFDYMVCSIAKRPEAIQLPYNELNYRLTSILLGCSGSGPRIPLIPSDISNREDASELSPDLLEKLFVFLRLGGTEREFWLLQQYQDMSKRGEVAFTPPQGLELVYIYDGRHQPNPKRRGLMEIRLEGDVSQLDVELHHTLRYHRIHPPFAHDGVTLERTSLSMFAGMLPSLVERAEATYQRAKH